MPRSPRRLARTCGSLRALRGRGRVGRCRQSLAKRILLKLSGEALMGDLEYGTDPTQIERIATQLGDVRAKGVEVAVVVGAGNIYRGLEGAAEGMDRATADYMGMLATVLNALTLQDALEKGRRHPGAFGDGRDRGRRALHPPPRDPPPGEGPDGDLRRRHRQPVLHHRHRRRPAGAGDPRRGDPDGEERGGGGVRLRPASIPTPPSFRRSATARRPSAACG